MGLFSGINQAETFERGKYVRPGFAGHVEIKKTLLKKTRKAGTAFIVEFRILESNQPDFHPVGSKATWFQKMTDSDVAFPAIAGFVAACSGYEQSDREAIREHVMPNLESILERAVDSEDDNDLTGLVVWLETEAITTQKGLDFTRYHFAPANEA